jgi:ATP-dependent Clp protease ATP-binding subunit ClpB
MSLVIKMLAEAGIRLEVSEAVRNRIAKLGFDPQFGARPLKRVLQREILNELSKQILAGKVHRDSVIAVDMKNEVEFVFENLEDVEMAN